jgi:hypothetical protein
MKAYLNKQNALKWQQQALKLCTILLATPVRPYLVQEH